MAMKAKKEDSAEKIRKALRDKIKDKCGVVDFAIKLYCALVTKEEANDTFIRIITDGVVQSYTSYMQPRLTDNTSLYPLHSNLKIKQPDEYLRAAFNTFNELIDPLVDKMNDNDLIYYALEFEG